MPGVSRASRFSGESVRVGRSEASSNGRPRGMVIAFDALRRTEVYRTRLTGQLAYTLFERLKAECGIQTFRGFWPVNSINCKPTLNVLDSYSVNRYPRVAKRLVRYFRAGF